jgi:hypothetical protein
VRRIHTPAISALRTSRFTRFLVTPLTLVALLSACGSYRQTTVGPGSLWNPTDRVRVTYDTGTLTGVAVLISASVVGDSLIGGRYVGSSHEPSQRLAIALEDITRIEQRDASGDNLKTGLIVGGVLAGTRVETI